MIGKTLQELRIGERAEFTKTISESDVYLYAGVTGDLNPAHIDEEYAKKNLFQDPHCPRYASWRAHFGCSGEQTARTWDNLSKPAS